MRCFSAALDKLPLGVSDVLAGVVGAWLGRVLLEHVVRA